MERYVRRKQMNKVEKCGIIFSMTLFLACIVYPFIFKAAKPHVIDAFKTIYKDVFNSGLSNLLITIFACVFIIGFIAYWIFDTYMQIYKNLAPLYLVLLFVVLLFGTFYFNEIDVKPFGVIKFEKFDYYIYIMLALAFVLLVTTIYSFASYIAYSKKIKKMREAYENSYYANLSAEDKESYNEAVRKLKENGLTDEEINELDSEIEKSIKNNDDNFDELAKKFISKNKDKKEKVEVKEEEVKEEKKEEVKEEPAPVKVEENKVEGLANVPTKEEQKEQEEKALKVEVIEEKVEDIEEEEVVEVKAEPVKKEEPKKETKPTEKKIKIEEDEEDDDDDDDDDDESEAIVEGFSKRVLLKLKTASPKTQMYYSELRNVLSCYTDLKFKSCNTGDTYTSGNRVICKVTIFPKALKVYFALDPKAFDTKKYHHKDASVKKKYENIPLLMRIGSDRSYVAALELVTALAKKYKAKKTKLPKVDYMPNFVTTSKSLLLENGGAQYLKSACTLEDCNEIPETLANKCVMLALKGPVEGEKVVAEISIGELSVAFKSTYNIDINLLKKVQLVDKKANYLKITSSSNCYKAVTVIADEFDPEVIKMMAITGGNIYRLVK